MGIDNKVEKFEATLNEAAEEARKTAAPLFLSTPSPTCLSKMDLQF